MAFSYYNILILGSEFAKSSFYLRMLKVDPKLRIDSRHSKEEIDQAQPGNGAHQDESYCPVYADRRRHIAASQGIHCWLLA